MGNEAKIIGVTASGYDKYQNVAQTIENKNHTQALQSSDEQSRTYRENQEYEAACKELEAYFESGTFKGPISMPIRHREDSNHAGASYEWGDAFVRSASNGYLKDEGNDGLTAADAKKGGYELAQLQKRQDPNTLPYTNQGGKKSDYYTISTEEDLVKAFNAFGYTRSKAAPKPADTKPVDTKPVEPKPVEPKPVEPKPVEPKPEGKEPISQEALKNTQDILIATLGLQNADVCLNFTGNSASAAEGYVESGTFTLKQGDGKTKAHDMDDSKAVTYKYEIKDGKVKLTQEGSNKSKSARIRTNDNGQFEIKKHGLLGRYNRVSMENPAEANAPVPRAEAKRNRETDAAADKTAANQPANPQFPVDKKKAKAVAKDQYWGSNSKRGQAIELKDEAGNVVASYPAYDQITVKKKNLARVLIENEDGSKSYKFYEPTAIIVPGADGNQTVVVPDMSKEVKYGK